VKQNSYRRGYGRAHQQRRAAIAPIVAAGNAVCRRCHKPIMPGQAWDLGHLDGTGKQVYGGPEHRACNRAGGARQTNARRAGNQGVKTLWSRRWYEDVPANTSILSGPDKGDY
jgi:hypothetical protein